MSKRRSEGVKSRAIEKRWADYIWLQGHIWNTKGAKYHENRERKAEDALSAARGIGLYAQTGNVRGEYYS